MLQNNWSVISKVPRSWKPSLRGRNCFRLKEIKDTEQLNATCDFVLDFSVIKEHYWENWWKWTTSEFLDGSTYYIVLYKAMFSFVGNTSQSIPAVVHTAIHSQSLTAWSPPAKRQLSVVRHHRRWPQPKNVASPKALYPVHIQQLAFTEAEVLTTHPAENKREGSSHL